jgi:hypothetical protein
MKPRKPTLRWLLFLALCLSLLLASSPGLSSQAGAAPLAPQASAVDPDGGICPLDIYVLMDLTGAMGGPLATLQANASTIVSTILAGNPNTRFGIGWFQDYPYTPYGGIYDKPYVRALDLTFDTLAFSAGLNSLVMGYGGDTPESQAPALYQTVTGEGDGIYIPAGQQANFRSEAAKVIVMLTDAPFHLVYGGIPGASPATYAEAAAALQALPRAQVVGIFSNPEYPAFIIDLQNIARDTGSLAPPGGLDCNGDGTPDILAGEPLVCTVSYTGAGIPNVFVRLVETVTDCWTRLPIVVKGP